MSENVLILCEEAVDVSMRSFQPPCFYALQLSGFRLHEPKNRTVDIHNDAVESTAASPVTSRNVDWLK